MTVLSYAFERAAGEPFDALLQRRLRGPLGMRTATRSAGVRVTPPVVRRSAGTGLGLAASSRGNKPRPRNGFWRGL